MTLCANRFAILSALFGLLTIMTGCSNDTPSDQTGAGSIVPIVSVDSNVAMSMGASRITIAPLPEADELAMTISTADGALSHTWNTLVEYDPTVPYLPGSYVVEVRGGSLQSEGFEAPYFYGKAEVDVADGVVSRPEIVCSLANTMVTVAFSPEFGEYFTDCELTFHSRGGGYIIYHPGETRQAYLRPGNIDVSLGLTMPDGHHTDFMIATIPNALAGYCYEVGLKADISGEFPTVTLSTDERIDSDDVTVVLTPEFLAGAVPEISCKGFESGMITYLPEGTEPKSEISCEVSGADVRRLMLTTDAPYLLEQGWPSEMDLLALSTSQSAMLKEYGLTVANDDNVTKVDFTALLSKLRIGDGESRAIFGLCAVTASGKVSKPVTLTVELDEVEVELLAVTPATVGVDRASMTVGCRNADALENISVELFSPSEGWLKATIEDIEPLDAENRYILRFAVPNGTSAVNARLLYCGEVKAETRIGRISPHYVLEVDAFAHKAVVRVVPDNLELLAFITANSLIYSGSERMISSSRNPQSGEIVISGLSEKTRYTFRATLLSSPSQNDFTEAVAFDTEAATPLPNGDFEEVKQTINWPDMPSGGRYSQNIVEIFNQQNYVTWKLNTPTGWANVNAKTFCEEAKNVNTWYMQPSVQTTSDAYSGSYAVRIDNVGWDTNGPNIKPYLQEGQPYTNYSLVVPEVANRAVGKIFLGEYSFDASSMTERYNDVVKFGSRPTSLNGLYKFSPASSVAGQTGLARVEVRGVDATGKEVVIAGGEMLLAPATGYTAFSVPLTYNLFGVKATAIKVMLAATAHPGTIAEENVTTITIDRPDISAVRGSTLWVDNLTFSY